MDAYAILIFGPGHGPLTASRSPSRRERDQGRGAGTRAAKALRAAIRGAWSMLVPGSGRGEQRKARLPGKFVERAILREHRNGLVDGGAQVGIRGLEGRSEIHGAGVEWGRKHGDRAALQELRRGERRGGFPDEGSGERAVRQRAASRCRDSRTGSRRRACAPSARPKTAMPSWVSAPSSPNRLAQKTPPQNDPVS